MILHEGGFRSLYKGFGPVLIAAVPASILFMVSYEASQQFLKEGDWKLGQFFRQHALITHGFSALSAELVSALLWVPQDVLRLRQQASVTTAAGKSGFPINVVSFKTCPSPRHLSLSIGQFQRALMESVSYYPARIQSILHKDGIRGLYRGLGATLSLFGPLSVVYFTSFEAAKAFYQKRSSEATLSTGQLTLSASFAGVCSGFLTNGLDVVKTRMQVQNHSGLVTPYHYRNCIQGLYRMIKDEGTRSLFKGAVPRTFRFALFASVHLPLYTILKQNFARSSQP